MLYKTTSFLTKFHRIHGSSSFSLSPSSLLLLSSSAVRLNMVRGSSQGGRGEEKLLTLENLNPCVIKMEYAVRGPLVIRAAEIEKELERGVKKNYESVIRANIGDCHAMGQVPISFIRQVMALCTLPEELMDDQRFESDAKERAVRILKGCKGGSIGSYSDSSGVDVIRRDAAQYISRRDGGITSDYLNILLCAGASEGIKSILKLLKQPDGSKKSGVMVPIPQYPLYSASIAEFDMYQIGYYLNEEDAWSLSIEELKRAVAEARKHCNPRAIVVINPGNPTGQVLTRQNIENIIKFAEEEQLFVMADEVYQDNVYAADREFHSFKKVLSELGPPYSQMELASFHSASKGYMGECGQRGGYCEIVNMDPHVKAMLLKSISAKLCPTIMGQTVMGCVVNPPQPGEPSYEKFKREKESVLHSLAERAGLVHTRLNQLEGISCNVVQGAMYAFPQLQLPQKFIDKAKSVGQEADFFYAMQLLESKGICVVPGSGFGQKPGTYHFRMTILPQPPKLREFLDRLEEFHSQMMKEYS